MALTPGQKAFHQRLRDTRLKNARERAQNDEPHFTRFLTRSTKYKIKTLKWTVEGLITEIDLLRAELAEAKKESS